MTKSATREAPPQPNEQPQPRHRNIYDYDGEYEFPTVQHWTAPGVPAPSAIRMSALCHNRTRAVAATNAVIRSPHQREPEAGVEP
jgi:hypothetical protein